MIEHIHKDVVELSFDKYGDLKGDKNRTYTIDFDVIINVPLNQMCKDLLELLKDKEVFYFSIKMPVDIGLEYEIRNRYWDLAFVEEIVFEEYYLLINGFKIFYNEIMGFSRVRKI